MKAAVVHVLVIWGAMGVPLGLAIGAALLLSRKRTRG